MYRVGVKVLFSCASAPGFKPIPFSKLGLTLLISVSLVVAWPGSPSYGKGQYDPPVELPGDVALSQSNPGLSNLENPRDLPHPAETPLPPESSDCPPVEGTTTSEGIPQGDVPGGKTGCVKESQPSQPLEANQDEKSSFNPWWVIVPLAIGGGVAAGLLIASGSNNNGSAASEENNSPGDTGGISGPSNPPPSSPPVSTPLQEAITENFDADLANSFLSDAEFLGMNSINRGNAISPNQLIKSHIAYGYGLSGKGTRLVIMDQGAILETHDEFAGKTILTLDPGELVDHTNLVTGLAAASRNNTGIMGIAHGAEILSTSFQDIPNPPFLNKINWITENNGDVWSNSWGLIVPQNETDEIDELVAFRNSNGVTSGQALADALNAPGSASAWDAIAVAMDQYQANGGILVWANNNSQELSDAGLMAGFPELYPQLKEAWIVVVNATAESTLQNARVSSSGFKTEGGYALLSTPCGSTAPYCVSMDGFMLRSVLSTGNQDYGVASGTSMAAPLVAGAMALLREAFPNHTAEELTIRALASADNSWFTPDGTIDFGHGIQHAYSRDFGHGFIDLARALQPLGTVITTSASSQAFNLSDGSSEIQMSPAFGTSLEHSLAERQFIMQDGLDGRFITNLGNFVRIVNPKEVQEMKTAWQRQVNQQPIQVPLVSGLVLRFDQQFQPNTLLKQQNGSSIELRASLSNGSILRANYGGSISTALGFQPKRGTNTVLAQTEPFEIPFAGFALASVWGTWQTGSPDNGWTLGWFGNEDEDYASTGALADKTWSLGETVALNVTGGTVTEKGGLLRTRTSGAFANDISTTSFARAAVNVDLVRNWSIMAHYMVGYSWAEADEKTLFTDFSNIVTDSFTLSLTGENFLTAKDRLQLTLFQPLRALSGSTTVTLPTDQDATNNYALLYTSESIDLSPKGRELRFIGSYSQEPWEGAKIDFTAALTHQRFHDPTAGISASIFTGLKIAF